MSNAVDPKNIEQDPCFDDIMRVIDVALKEDIRTGDITSEACIGAEEVISGRLLLKQGGRISGLPFLERIFHRVDPDIQVSLFVEEGSEHRAGTVIGTVRGHARGIFSAERVALNFIQHASGITTLTSEYVERLEGVPCDILDTRKTLPGLRALEKYAVRVGGGTNHRYGLDDRFIIKHHHLSFIARETRHAIREAVRRAKAYKAGVMIEVEVEDLHMVEEAIESEADIIMLDHMPLPMVRKAVAMVKGAAYVEACGGITLDTLRSYAEAGVNGVSIGAITYSVPGIDISLRF
jgi:nicotinate-nucleotide pyrophosphorylase (carboxylating)